jgi:hypothetical protein
MKTFILLVALALTPTIVKPSDPFEGIQGVTVDMERLCHDGVCILPTSFVERVFEANRLLAERLEKLDHDRTKKCATVVPIPKGKST